MAISETKNDATNKGVFVMSPVEVVQEVVFSPIQHVENMQEIVPVLLFTVVAKYKCEPANGYNYNSGNSGSQFGELLKPPPPPRLSIVPVPFHGGANRLQRQNVDVGYNYQPPPPPSPMSQPNIDFKFPAPFYKQYNFNFVPPPQPFTTTPSPTIFQKVSGWLFPSQQTSYDTGSTGSSSYNIAPLKKDCNPCNLVPWIPVIRYDVGNQNIKQIMNPTYGPPSPTANIQNAIPYHPQPFNFKQYKQQNLDAGVPHLVYGPPGQSQVSSTTIRTPVSTYGPPSPTHTISISQYGIPSSTTSDNIPNTWFGGSKPSHEISSISYGLPSSSYRPFISVYVTPSPVPDEGNFLTTIPPTKSVLETLNREIEPSNNLQLPKVSNPTGFKNSYGESISNTYLLDIPYPVSATAAESTKVKTEVLPNDDLKSAIPNMSLALANPAPFTLNRGRNIHTLQPVALPNLSVSPLPPIFNARPFRPIIPPNFPMNILQPVNHIQQNPVKVNVEKSVPVAEFVHSIEYPTTIIQSPVIDIDDSKILNQTKAYRNIPNSYIIDNVRDISSQASEDHVSATSNQDSSFETTGAEYGNDLYDSAGPIDLKNNVNVPSNHRPHFADLRGVKDVDVDKYRTESNLQNIDSPLLYLKPSAPHKNYENFVLAFSTPHTVNDYELYDDIPTTIAPQISTLTSAWDESRTYFKQDISPPAAQEKQKQPKIVQIIVPYTTGHKDQQNNLEQDWSYKTNEEYQARKVQPETETNIFSTVTESYTTLSTTTEEATTSTEQYESNRLNTPAILNDLYDVKEPPFDIIKLQHTIDDWTEQEYSKHYKPPQRTRSNENYAKQIPDEFFTTISPFANYVTETNNYNYELFDHEGSSSIQHSISERKNNSSKPRKEYNVIERTKSNYNSGKNEVSDDVQRLHIYTAASSFRTTTTTTTSTTTPAPWGQIQTSISPLTKEKVYVVTSKPWRERPNMTNEYTIDSKFESKKTHPDNHESNSDNMPFKSPRFSNRPSIGFSTAGTAESDSLDESYGFSKSWYENINSLRSPDQSDNAPSPEGPEQNFSIEEDPFATRTVESRK